MSVASICTGMLPSLIFRWNARKVDDGERLARAVRSAEGKRLRYREPSGSASADSDSRDTILMTVNKHLASALTLRGSSNVVMQEVVGLLK